MSEPKLTQQEYIQSCGMVCPFCKEHGTLDAYRLEHHELQVFQQVICIACGASFTDVYELKGFEPDEEDSTEAGE